MTLQEEELNNKGLYGLSIKDLEYEYQRATDLPANRRGMSVKLYRVFLIQNIKRKFQLNSVASKGRFREDLHKCSTKAELAQTSFFRTVRAMS
jgi:hypothetical protein